MNPQQARNLVTETFPQAFEKTRFRNFTLNLLNKFDESKAQTWNTTYIKDAFKPHIQKYERLGTYTSLDNEKLDVLIVYLTAESKLERTRTAIRNFVADHLKTRDNKDAALVAFVSPSEKQWRFSYVKMEYTAAPTKTGKVGVETHLTPARRFSYIVGEGESCHTAQSRFLTLLQNTENLPTLVQIEEAFSVEAVTKEFFSQYAALFADIETELQKLIAKNTILDDEFKKKHVNSVDFAKKLLGQIVFLYFLQKKGWLGVEKSKDWGTGPHDFLRRLANGEYKAYGNFFNDILEPLFYDTLATDRGHDAWCKTFKCRIPFLNGGLFEPIGDYDWRKADITLPNKLFTNTEQCDKGDVGTGILDVFDRYNFTVNEAEPLEKEVAIDPEMLGKVFENLIEENRRKGLGSYYTPREIVHYMCQESLINYLDTAVNTSEGSIAKVKPKQGKLFGAPEPVQMGLKTTVRQERVPRADLETFVHLGDQISHYEAVEARYTIKMPKSIEQHARLIDEKLVDITVCDPAVGSGAFPVGMMSEIVRARSALTPYFNDVNDRRPYHFKRHAIQNCLYGVDIDPGAVEIAKLRLWLSLVVDEEDVKQIKPLPNLFYKIVTGNSLLGVNKDLLNQHLFKRLEELKPRFFDEPDKRTKDHYKQQIENTIHELTNGKGAFDFEIYFSEVFHSRGGFDVVIGNPPYIGERKNKEVFLPVQEGKLKCYYFGRMDYFYFFLHLALDIGNANAVAAFITTNYYPTALGARKLRKDMMKRASILRLINFNELKIFESASGQHNMITIYRKGRDERLIAETCSTKAVGVATSQLLAAILSGDNGVTTYQKIPQSQLWEGEEAYLRIAGSVTFGGNPLQSILGKMMNAKDRFNLGDLCNTLIGLESSLDVVYVLKKMDIEKIVRSAHERKLFKPFYKNSDIQRYIVAADVKQFILYIHEDIDDIKTFPGIWSYLNAHKKRISSRKGANLRGAYRRGHWWVLNTPRLDMNFEGEKLVTPYRTKTTRFAFSDCPWYASRDVYFITRKNSSIDLKYILGLLNSRLYYLWLYNKGKRKGEMMELYSKPLSEIPIKKLCGEDQKPFIALVDRILAAKKQDSEADISELEREIDQLVYELYDLTPAEIQIVESAANSVDVLKS